MKLGGMMMRLAAYDYSHPAGAAIVSRAGCALAALHRALYRAVRGPPLHVREQLPGREDGHRLGALWNAFKRIARSASASEKLALFSGTAWRVYRLD